MCNAVSLGYTIRWPEYNAQAPSGQCEILVDYGSQNRAIDYLYLIPNYLRQMADWILNQCVARSGTGGFVTLGLGDTVDYLVNPATNFFHDYRKIVVSSSTASTGPTYGTLT